jgi:hypothetical protein
MRTKKRSMSKSEKKHTDPCAAWKDGDKEVKRKGIIPKGIRKLKKESTEEEQGEGVHGTRGRN